MTFVNWTILIGLAAVAVPILIHLLNRRRARAVEWGAMRFLLASVASRNRRIMLEEMLLMILRCLAVAMLVLAIARPFMPSRSSWAVLIVLPAVVIAAALAAAGGVLRNRPRLKWTLWIIAAVMLASGALATQYEQALQNRLWQGGGQKDIAIVIDASSSMNLNVEGQSNFQRALDEARAVVESAPAGDAITIVLAGAVPRAILFAPTNDRKDVLAALSQALPSGGSLNAPEAIAAAAATLSQGRNLNKQIVLITDSQALGWDLESRKSWETLWALLNDMPHRPGLVVRTLKLPQTFSNLALSEIRQSRQVVGTDRPLKFSVPVTNTGTAASDEQNVELLVDGLSVAMRSVGKLPPNGSEQVQFEHRFEKPGLHTTEARLAGMSMAASAQAGKDDMPFDDRVQRVVEVLDSLPVLLVDGLPSPLPLQGAADFAAVALAPTLPAGETALASQTGKQEHLVMPRVISPSDAAQIDFAAYRVVILADVKSLPASTADRLAQFVQRGGGLLIAPGGQADVNFYNNWAAASGVKVCPAAIDPQRAALQKPIGLAISSFSHPSLELLTQSGRSDSSRILVHSYWPMKVSVDEASIQMAALLDNSQPFLVQGTLGLGCVMMSAIALDRRDSNLPSLECFVTLLHELTYHLAAPSLCRLNMQPAQELRLNLPLDGKHVLATGQSLQVITPSGRRLMANVQVASSRLEAGLTGADEPGLYRLMLPQQPDAQQQSLPFSILADGRESRMEPLDQKNIQLLAKDMNPLHVQSASELVAAISGAVPGKEIWPLLAVLALGALVLEIALTRWIARQRKSDRAETVKFGSDEKSKIESSFARHVNQTKT